jgi:hypothetical protein
MTDQELRAKALEVAALILGPTDTRPHPHVATIAARGSDKTLTARVSGAPLDEMFTVYHELANLVEQDIRGDWKPKTE